MALAAGDLRHLVQIQKPQSYQDQNTGELRTRWKMVVQVHAQITPSSVNAFIAANARQSEVRGHIVIRRRDDVDATMRVVCVSRAYKGMAYQILGVLADPVSGMEYQTLPVSAGVRVA